MEKNETIDLMDQIQMYIWTSGVIVFSAVTIWVTIWGLVEGSGLGLRALGYLGMLGMLCVTNFNIVLNRISYREGMRKSGCSDRSAASQSN